jgi:cytoskeletal protein RodZ
MEEISYASSHGPNRKRLPKRLLVFGGLFLVVLLLLGSAIYFIAGQNPEQEEDEVATTISLPDEEEATETPTPTEEAEVTPEDEDTTPTRALSKAPTGTGSTAKSSVRVAVQNGSGETGVAATAAEVLREAGYTIASTGNADNTNYTDVTIQVKNSKKASLAGIEDVLSEDYTIGETSTDLPESTSYDALVIIGK